MGIWTKKTVGGILKDMDSVAEADRLHRGLSTFDLLTLGIASVVGAGIFVLTGNVAAQYAGPAVAVCYILAGVASLFAALCYAEFAAMIPVSGSAYTYAYVTFGELFAWIIGWDLLLEYLFSVSTVAVGWSGYFTGFLELFGLHIPTAFSNAPFMLDAQDHFVRSAAILNLPAMGIVILCSALLYVGVKMSALANNLMVAVNITILLMVIAFGLAYVHPEYWHPFLPENTGISGHFGWSGVFRGSAVIFFAYVGFDVASTAAQEAKDPQKSMPIAILGTLGFCTALYVAMALVMTGMAHYQDLNGPAPIAMAITKAGPGLAWLNTFVKWGATIGLATTILATMYGQVRVLFAMSRDGLLPKNIGRVHKQYRTPYVATMITGAAAVVIAALLPIDLLGELVSIGTLLAFVFVCGGVLVLRYRHPDLERPFKAPFFPWVPIFGILICLYLMAGLPLGTWVRLIVWMAAGLLLYFTYGRFQSLRGAAEREAGRAAE
jgi:APA family basic amino acid/polyamine antiporter